MESNPNIWSVGFLSGLYRHWCVRLHWQEAWWMLLLEQQPHWFQQVWGSCHPSVTGASVFAPGVICQHRYRVLNASNASILSGWGLAVWSNFYRSRNSGNYGWAFSTIDIWHIQLFVADANRAEGKLSVFLEIWCSQKTKSFNSPALLKNNSRVLLTRFPSSHALNPWDLNVGGSMVKWGVGVTLSKEVLLLPDNPTHPSARTHLLKAHRAQWSSACFNPNLRVQNRRSYIKQWIVATQPRGTNRCVCTALLTRQLITPAWCESAVRLHHKSATAAALGSHNRPPANATPLSAHHPAHTPLSPLPENTRLLID